MRLVHRPARTPSVRRTRAVARRVLAASVAALALAGCGGGGGTAPTDGPAGTGAPTSPPTTPATDASDGSSDAIATSPAAGSRQVVGQLGGSDIEGGCAWVDAEDGTRYELIAAPDARIAIDPANIVVVDREGAVIAESGDRVAVEGVVDEGIMTFCQVGVPLVVTEVSAA